MTKIDRDIKNIIAFCVFGILSVLLIGKSLIKKLFCFPQLLTATEIIVLMIFLSFIAFLISLPIMIIRWERNPK